MINIGTVLEGFCGGWFGRDSYDDKRVEAVGEDWIVARDANGEPVFAHGDGILYRMGEYVKEHSSNIPPPQFDQWKMRLHNVERRLEALEDLELEEALVNALERLAALEETP